ncbi:MAG: hypothetical protein ACRDC0_12870, partial [Aeromonas veronii]
SCSLIILEFYLLPKRNQCAGLAIGSQEAMAKGAAGPSDSIFNDSRPVSSWLATGYCHELRGRKLSIETE